MPASFTIAARNNAFSKADARAATSASVRAYRKAMADFAQMRTMDIWYAHLPEDELLTAARRSTAKKDKKQAKALKQAEKNMQKAHTRDSLQALSKLSEVVDGRYRIVSQPPIVVPARDLAATGRIDANEVEQIIYKQLRTYRATLQDDRRQLLEKFQVVDFARKVVPCGSSVTNDAATHPNAEDPSVTHSDGVSAPSSRLPRGVLLMLTVTGMLVSALAVRQFAAIVTPALLALVSGHRRASADWDPAPMGLPDVGGNDHHRHRDHRVDSRPRGSVPALVENQLHTSSPLIVGLVFAAYMAGTPISCAFSLRKAATVRVRKMLPSIAVLRPSSANRPSTPTATAR